jgi:ribonuclease Y
MPTLTAAAALLIGGGLAYAAYAHAKRRALNDALRALEARASAEGEERLSAAQERAQQRLQRATDQARQRAERDAAALLELDEEEAHLTELEAGLDERVGRQREREEALDARHTEQRGRGDALRAQQRALKGALTQAERRLEERAEVTREALCDELKGRLVEQAQVEAQLVGQKRVMEAEAHAAQRASALITLSSERYYDPRPAERLLSYVELPKNERRAAPLVDPSGELLVALREVTQVEFALEDASSGRLMIRSAPESYTKELARVAFDRWVQSGAQLTEATLRAHYAKARAQMESQARRAGAAAAQRLGVKGVHPEVLHLVGKLLYRTSYTQNQWQHAIESAELCGLIAQEIGIDPTLAHRATLLHDIGKVLWAETEAVGSHAVSGAAFAREHGEPPEVVHPIAAHHHDEAPSSALSFLVIAADTLSGARPGARRETSEAFSQHVEQLEAICADVKGLQSYMVIQGGREVRLQVDHRQRDDLQVARLTQELAELIEDSCVFPGQVKVTALREVMTSALAQSGHARNPRAALALAERLAGPRVWRGGEVG